MQVFSAVPVWKEAPFLRLLLPFISGIIIQWYFPLPLPVAISAYIIALCFVILWRILPLHLQFRHAGIQGICITTFLFITGIVVMHFNSSRNHPHWLGHHYQPAGTLLVTIEEPLTEKPRSYKAIATVHLLQLQGKRVPVKGRILVYFQKDSVPPSLHYGDQLLFTKSLQPVRNSGNPAAFDFERYCSFQHIYHQVFLSATEWQSTGVNNGRPLKRFLFSLREQIVSLLQGYIPGKKEYGLAEALLIGYKDDLDKSLVQSYSDTGVVHVIAISGLHLGLIYVLLNRLLQPLAKRKGGRWIKPIVLLVALWLFSLLSGASPSVLRSAVMFSCIIAGESRNRNIAVLNSLAASAFLLLCYNPFWLWDAGFLLSYSAVASIVIFMKPVYHLLNFRYKVIDATWKLLSVTIAAQVLTTPISIYYFHQFPLTFLVGNIVAVPLSSIILIGELLLCIVSWLPAIAEFVGRLLHYLIQFLNYFIETLSKLPFATWKGLEITWVQVILLYIILSSAGCWWLQKQQKAIFPGLLALLLFVFFRAASFQHASRQQQLIIYNIARHSAISISKGRRVHLFADSSLLADKALQQYHLQPVFSKMRALTVQESVLIRGTVCYQKWVLSNSSDLAHAGNSILLITRNQLLPGDYLPASVNGVIVDASNSRRTAERWRSACAKGNIRFHDVTVDGAFVMRFP